MLGHNLGFAVLVTLLAAAVARRCAVTAVLSLASFHLHLLFDLAGSRGTDGSQWPIPYLAPFSNSWQLSWSGQWLWSGWQNTTLTVVLVAATVYLAWCLGYSPVGLLSVRADKVLVSTLRRRFRTPTRH